MLAVFGLGNPGRKYEGTRHNVGFRVIDRLAEMLGADISRRRFEGLIGEADAGQGPVLLVKPQAYMNESGRTVRAVMAWHRLELNQIFVICDDLDLELGKLRVRRQGSSGGHNGLKSIRAAVGTDRFPRLRIGIGRPAPEEAVDYVLSRFTGAEREIMTEAVNQAADAVQCWMGEGIEACMNRFN